MLQQDNHSLRADWQGWLGWWQWLLATALINLCSQLIADWIEWSVA